jgi:enhancing lycopene biosynthesis protein 2
MAKVALILSGCGHQDGSEIHEAVLLLLELCSQGHHYQCFAPNKAQTRVVNHHSHQAMNESRNCLIESARIARGQISDLKELKESAFDALVFPGGFGAALNLCDYGVKRLSCSVDPDVLKAILSFYKARKPIGATCIAPIILAKALEGNAIELTLGSSSQEQKVLQQMGIKKAQLLDVQECLSDQEHRIYTTPCYMENANISQIHQGIKKLIQAMFEKL